MREGWETKKLGEVCEMIKRGIAPKYIKTGGVCVVNQKCVRNHYVSFEMARRHNIELKNVPDERFIRIGDVLVNSTGVGTLGRVAQMRMAPPEPTTVDTHVTIARPFSELFHLEFFGYMMVQIEDEIAISGEGASGQTELSRASLERNFLVSYPTDKKEQKRIVGVLDEAFGAIGAAVANAQKNLTNARELFETTLNNIFTRKGEGWTQSTLGEVCEFQGGSQPPKALFSTMKRDDHIRLIQIRDYKSDKHIVYIPKSKARKFCDSSDVMIGRYGPPLFQILRGIEGAYNVALMKAAPNEGSISKDFLYYFLQNGNILRYIINASNRAAGQIGLNKATLEPYPISYPSIEKQRDLVFQLQTLLEKTRRLEAIYQQKLDDLAELKQSILQKSFAGELISSANTATPEFSANVLAFIHHHHKANRRNKSYRHVKAQKALHLVESIAGVELGRKPEKDAAGPNDFQHMLGAENWAKEQQFFEFVKSTFDGGYDFKKLARYDEMKVKAFTTLKPYHDQLEKISNLLLDKNKIESEVFTTVHAAWNNLIIDGVEITDEAILYEARENWHRDKLDIPISKFKTALREIDQKNLAPDGSAKYVGKQQGVCFEF